MALYSVIAGRCNVEHTVTRGVFQYRDQCTEYIWKSGKEKVKKILFCLRDCEVMMAKKIVNPSSVASVWFSLFIEYWWHCITVNTADSMNQRRANMWFDYLSKCERTSEICGRMTVQWGSNCRSERKVDEWVRRFENGEIKLKTLKWWVLTDCTECWS